MLYHDFSLFYEKVKMIMWSIRTFWYNGSAENKKMTTSKKELFLSKIAAQIRRLIFRKSLDVVVRLFIGYRLCRRPLKKSAADDFWRPWLSWAAPGLSRAAKVGYLGLPCRREHRFQGQGEVEGAQGLTSCGSLWRPVAACGGKVSPL